MTEKKKILIIDDDKDYGEALRIVLENNGFKVDHVLNIQDGRKTLEADRPDLIILDVMMDKHTDGFDFCYSLKHDDTCSNIPILMVTAVTDKTGFKFSPETDGEYLQADDYVAKPIPVPELLSRVKKLIG
ncbi:MAG: response regulator transcription factor [Deltaproteobacteria bacterium]|jgi:two-component system alkaline phosphatase synthesis response regulator PhoP